MALPLSPSIDTHDCPTCRDQSTAAEDAMISQGRPRGVIVLIDDLPLGRASTLTLLRRAMRNAVEPYPDIDRFLVRTAAATVVIDCIIMNVGARALDDPDLAEPLRRLEANDDAAPLVLLSDRENLTDVVAAYQCGARGYIPSSMRPDAAIEALRLVQGGTPFFPATTLCGSGPAGQRVSLSAEADHPVAAAEDWTRRQLGVLHLLGQGMTNKEIARELGTEESTIKVHVWRIMRRLGQPNRTQTVLRARELGILSADAPAPSATNLG